MKRRMAVPAALLLAGCASGGGSSGSLDALGQVGRCILSLGLACGPEEPAAEASAGSNPPPPPSFTSWAGLRRDAATTIPASASVRSAYGSSNDALLSGFISGSARVHYGDQGQAISLSLGQALTRPSPAPVGNPAATGQGWFDYVAHPLPAPGAVSVTASSPFFSTGVYDVELAANPYALGWNYQSFGVWDAAPADYRTFGGMSFGAPTPSGAVPLNGSAIFTGKLAGFYMPPSGEGALATAELTVEANFGARSLDFNSANTALTRDFAATTPAPALNLSGTLNFSAGSAFEGTLSNAGGTMSGPSRGMFYGPAGEELGGAFWVASPDTTERFSGAYGAKR